MMMKVLVILMLVSLSISKLVSFDQTVYLFKKFVSNDLTKVEAHTLNKVVDILEMNQKLTELTGYNTTKSRMILYCFACRVVATVLFDAVHMGFKDKPLVKIITKLCTLLRVQSHAVCKGVSELHVPILAYIVKNTCEAQPRTLCGLIFQNDFDPDFCRNDDPRFEWQVDLPDPGIFKMPPTSGRSGRTLKVALITDAHLDPLYDPNGVANCGEPTCCRKGQSVDQAIQYRINETFYENTIIIKKGEVFLDLNFVSQLRKIKIANRFRPDQSAARAGYWGDYRNCDTPLRTFDDVVDRISSAHKGVNVMYYIGDTIDHHVWETTYERNNLMNSYVINKLRRSFGDDVLIVPVIGNHEGQPVNQFAPASIRREKLNTTWLYKSLARKWALRKNARATFWNRGVYSVSVRPGLRAIIVNTNVAYRYNWWLVYNPLEAKKHLEWLIDELYQAELAGEIVHILTHIPPGVSDLTQTWTREYNRVINRFAGTIAAEFNGHTHSDEFKLYYNAEGRASVVAWNGGGVTTYSDYNPNYKIIELHPSSYQPTKIENYIFNLTKANLTPKQKPHWFRIYDFKQKFRLRDLSPGSMNELVNNMAMNKDNFLDSYINYIFKLSDARPLCDKDCRLNYLCSTVVTVLWQREKCNSLRDFYRQ